MTQEEINELKAEAWREAMNFAAQCADKKAAIIQDLMHGSDEETFAVQAYASSTARELAGSIRNIPNPYEATL